MSGFRQLSHTADVKIEAWGPDFPAALVQCVRGFTSLVTDVMIDRREERHVGLRASNKDALLYDLIAYLVYLKDTETFLASDAAFTVGHNGMWTLVGTVRGSRLEGIALSDVKAMTYHDLTIDAKHDKTTIRFVVDL